jgi:hypothetical protein
MNRAENVLVRRLRGEPMARVPVASHEVCSNIESAILGHKSRAAFDYSGFFQTKGANYESCDFLWGAWSAVEGILGECEKENSKLKRLVAELSLEKQILKDVAEGNF